MPQVYSKVAGNSSAPQQIFMRKDNTNFVLTVTHKMVEAKTPKQAARIIKTTIDVRTVVDLPSCDPNACPPKFPALVKLEYSAPEGQLPADLLAAVLAANTAFTSSSNSVFFPQIETVTVA